MNTIDMREQVRQALSREWPTFAAAHPRLANVVDETLLLEPAMKALDEDEEFQETMRTAAEIGAAGEVVANVVSRVINKWLLQLV